MTIGSALGSLTRSTDRGDQITRTGDRAEDRLLAARADDIGMAFGVGRGATVLQQQALEPAVAGLAQRAVDAAVGRDAAQHQVGDAAEAQDRFEIGRVERALSWL